ncbi:MAG: cold shock domain-containing protein [Bacteroidetes bacterium]|nr:cold shock domain-containing protein [Bacteroidota bacterium]
MAMQRSTVKWFDAKKGYGFIHHPDEGEDIFVHYTQIDSDKDFKTLRTGQTVEFEMNDGPKGLHALSVNAIGQEGSDNNVGDVTPSSVPSPSNSSPSAADASMNSEQSVPSSGSSSPADPQSTL